MSGSPSPCVEWAGLRLPMYRYQTAAARCVRWQLANRCRRAETTAARRAAMIVACSLNNVSQVCLPCGRYIFRYWHHVAGVKTVHVQFLEFVAESRNMPVGDILRRGSMPRLSDSVASVTGKSSNYTKKLCQLSIKFHFRTGGGRQCRFIWYLNRVCETAEDVCSTDSIILQN